MKKCLCTSYNWFDLKGENIVIILIKHAGIPVSIIESVRLKSRDSNILAKHINKVLAKYDQNGCRLVNLIIYGMMVDFSSFWMKLINYLKEYIYPYEVVSELEEFHTLLAESRHAMLVLKREGMNIQFHVYAIHMRG